LAALITLELSVRAGADEHQVEDEADELVGETEKHARGTRPVSATIRTPARWPCSEVYPTAAPGGATRCPTELTLGGIRHNTLSTPGSPAFDHVFGGVVVLS
jgi:hypothetical protein